MKFANAIIAGCYDNLHEGHKWFLDQCSEYTDHLFICLATDQSIRFFKDREPMVVYSERERQLRDYLKCRVSINPIHDKVLNLNFETNVEWRKPKLIIIASDQLHIPDKLEAAVKYRIPALVLPCSEHKTSSTKLAAESNR